MASAEPETLADYVRRRRLRLGLTQETVAERAGLSVDTVSALERGLRRRLYPHTVRALADALGLDAAERTQFVKAAASGDEPTAAATPVPPESSLSAPAPPASPAAPTVALPVTLTSFVGRERELAGAAGLVADGRRLVTLTGAGGAGKTRLAIEGARAVAHNFPGGVWFVDLAPLAAGKGIADAVAAVLGVREVPGRDAVAGIIAALREQSLLLVLDNCEHVLEATAALVTALLPACPHLTVVITSREPLRLTAEQIYPVPPLPLPPGDAADAVVDPEAAMGFAAVRLFVDRARAVLPTFALTATNAAAVVEICRRLDGLPLAIELAAARVRVLAPEQIAARLDDRFRLVARAVRDMEPRHQTLRALIDWSHDLLSEAERVLLRRLAVFAGGCTLDAVEEVCSAPPSGTTDRPAPPETTVHGDEMVEVLTALVDKSLVVADLQSAAARYRLLESIREYAADKLEEAGEADDVRDRHAACLLRVARTARRGLVGPAQAESVQRLELEHHNLRSALGWTVARGDADSALTFCAALSMFWYIRGYYHEGRDWTARALACGPPVATRARATALHGAASLAGIQHDTREALELITESVALWRVLGERRGLAAALGELAMHARHEGDLAAARGACQEALAIYATSPDPWGERLALGVLGWVAEAEGDRPEAQRLMEQSLAAAQRAGSPTDVALQLNNLGILALRANDPRTAAARYREALRCSRDVDTREPMACSLEGLAGVASAQARHERAAQLLGAAASVRAAIGSPRIAQFEEEHRRVVPAVQAALGDQAFASAQAAGQALPLSEAIAYALEEPEPDVLPYRGLAAHAP